MNKLSHLTLVGCASLAVACGAGDNRLDPSDLELRDLLGIAPDTAMLWDADQREAARRVIDEAMRRGELAEHRAGLAARSEDDRLELDRRVARAIGVVDAQRAGHGAGAVGLANVALGTSELVARMRASGLGAGDTVELRFDDAWQGKPWALLMGRDHRVLAKLALDAGHAGGPLVVAPMPRLAAAAVYLTSPSPRLIVNPVVLAALEALPEEAAVARSAATATPAAGSTSQPGKLGSIVLFPATAPTAPPASPSGTAANALGNPYSFYTSIGACASDQQMRCASCVPAGTCVPVTDMTDGNAECSLLGVRGYSLVCINLALAIDMVASCTARRAPSCPQDVRASETFAALENNASFLDDAGCGQPLDSCLLEVFGASPDPTPPPPSPSDPAPLCDPNGCDSDPACDEACSGDTTCEGDGGSCDDGSGGDCGGGDGGGCGDGEDACGGSDNSACAEGDCGSDSGGCDGGEGGDCGGGGGCEGGGGGCEGGGGDCGGGGGDCGGGSDCSTSKRKHRSHGTLIAVIWALLPLPFALLFRRRRHPSTPAAPRELDEQRSDDLADFEAAPEHDARSVDAEPGADREPSTHEPGAERDASTHEPGAERDASTHEPSAERDASTDEPSAERDRSTDEPSAKREDENDDNNEVSA